jgi:hypothetical protein
MLKTMLMLNMQICYVLVVWCVKYNVHVRLCMFLNSWYYSSLETNTSRPALVLQSACALFQQCLPCFQDIDEAVAHIFSPGLPAVKQLLNEVSFICMYMYICHCIYSIAIINTQYCWYQKSIGKYTTVNLLHN